MSKGEWFLAGFLALLLFGVGAGSFFLRQEGSRIFVRPVSETSSLVEEEISADVLYEDEAGFSFKHPKGVDVTDATPEDKKYYARTILSSPGKGEMQVEMKEVKAEDLDEWLEKDSEAPGNLVLVGAVSLGGVSARQYSLDDKLFTFAVDENVLFRIESPGQEYWEKVHSFLVDSFSFKKQGKSSSGSPGSNVIYETEEVVE